MYRLKRGLSEQLRTIVLINAAGRDVRTKVAETVKEAVADAEVEIPQAVKAGSGAFRTSEAKTRC
jgi:methionine-rich copper-binding protein CopC